MKKYFILTAIFFMGCKKCPILPSSNETYEEINLGLCASSNLPNDEYIINSDLDYEKLRNSANCTSNFPNIDFSRKTLLGKFTSGKCKMTIVKSLISNEENKTLTYNLGICDKG